MRARLISRLKASQRPGVWSAVAGVCRTARAVSRRRALWSYRLGYALERADRLDEAGAAFTTACALAPGLVYQLPDVPESWDRPAVEFARSLAAYGIRYQRDSAVKNLLTRRGQVVPVVTRGARRRWTETAAGGDCAARLHLRYLTHRETYLPDYFARSERHRMPRTRLARAWRWYVGDVLVQSLVLVRRNGRFVREAAGVPVHRQIREMLALSVTLPSLPENYYRYEFYRADTRTVADHYLHGHENSPVLYQMLAEAENLAELAPLTDKVAFATRAVVSTLAVVEHGQVIASQPLPARDLFVKPLAGKRGIGIQKWVYYSDQDAYRKTGTTSPAVLREHFVSWLASQSAGQALLVQPCLHNHPELSDLALDAVVTCRVVTMTDEAGAPEPVIATFRMPAVRDAVVDNMHRGGIAAPVALDSGALGAASDYATAGPATRHTHHPVSGGPIEGRKLPLWEEVRELVCRAHESFRPRILVGWDVSIGPDGPLLLEGNERPGVGGLQRLHQTPLGAHRFGELLDHHLTDLFGAVG